MGACPERGEEHRGRGRDPAGVKVVLRDPYGREPARFGRLRESDHLPEPVRRGVRRVLVDHGEGAQPHDGPTGAK